MVFTSTRPITVDGVRLDTLAWNIEQVNRATAGRRSGDYSIPNVDGVLASLNDPLEPATYGLQMWLRGTDADGSVPPAGAQDTLRANLDELVHLFGQRHKLLDIREQVSATQERQALAKVVDTITPELNEPGSAGVFTVGFIIPSGQWQDPSTPDWSSPVGTFAGAEVTTLRGSTERINDAFFSVQGPITNPRLADPSTGMWVQLDGALASGEWWDFRSDTWTSQVVGNDRSGITSVGGPSRAYGLPLTPVRDSGERRVKLTLSGTGTAASTQVFMAARRKFAL